MNNPPKQRRADAARNAERVLRAARRCFADRGADISLEEVAKAAGVGVATVYRNFGGRTSLTHAVFAQTLRELNAAIGDIAASRGRTEALRLCLVELFERRAADRSLLEAIAGPGVSDDPLDGERAHLAAQLDDVFDRAVVANRVWNEFTRDDVLPLVLMVGAVADSPDPIGATSWRRYADLILDSLFDERLISRLARPPLLRRH